MQPLTCQDSLKMFIPHLEYHEFPQCSHEPEIEKHARADFSAILKMKNWLKKYLP